MTTVTRRNVLKSGTALVGGMAGILATGRAPPMRRARRYTGCAGTTSYRLPISCCARSCCLLPRKRWESRLISRP